MPGRVDAVARIGATKCVLMQAPWLTNEALIGVHRPESSLPLLVIKGPVVVPGQRRIKLLASEEVILRGRPSLRDQIAEGVVVVGVSDGAGGVGEEADGAVAVEAIETQPLAIGR